MSRPRDPSGADVYEALDSYSGFHFRAEKRFFREDALGCSFIHLARGREKGIKRKLKICEDVLNGLHNNTNSSTSVISGWNTFLIIFILSQS